MREALAFIIFVIIWVVIAVAICDTAPETAYGKTICANMNCYYEIKDKNE